MTDLTEWSTFVEIANRLGCRKETVEALLEFIDAPYDLICLQQVLRNFKRIIPLVRAWLKESPELFALEMTELDSWRWVIQLLLESEDCEFEEIPKYSRQTMPGKLQPKVLHLTSHPAYALLCHSHVSSNQHKFSSCQALSLLIDRTLRGQGEETESTFSDARYTMLLEVRKVAERGTSRYLDRFPDETMPVPELIEWLEKIDRDKLVHSLLVRLKPIARGLPPAQKTVEKRRVGHFPSQKRVRGSEQGKTTTPEPKESRAQYTRAATVPSEVGEDYSGKQSQARRVEDAMVLAGGGEKDDGSSVRQRALAGRGYRNRIAIQNQLLPSQKPGLSPWEGARLIALMTEAFENLDQEPDTMLALGIMLWCSVDLESLGRIRVYDQAEYEQAVLTRKTQPGFVISGRTLHWLTRPSVYRPKNTARAVKAETLVDHLLLPVPVFLKRLFRQRKPVVDFSGGKLFPAGKRAITEQVETCLRDLRAREYGGYTAARISRHLFHIGTNLPNSDITLAMYWSGRDHFLGQVVTHYTRVSVERLVRNYARTCLALVEQVKDELGAMGWGYPIRELEVELTLAEGTENAAVGSVFCPELSSVRAVFEALQRELDLQKPIKRYGRFPEQLVEIHNSLTLYTVLCFSLVTGARALDKAVHLPSRIDLELHSALIGEKDPGDRFSFRQIWIPPLVVAQYRNYLEHLEHVYEWLYVVNPTAAHRLKAVLTEDKLPPEAVEAWLFFLTDDHCVVRLTAQNLSARLKEFGYHFKGNALRHLLRSEAVRCKVAPEVLNAQLGHWENGQEPWGPWSFFSVDALQKGLGPFMDELLSECGVKAVAGVGGLRENKDWEVVQGDNVEPLGQGNHREQLSLF